MRRGMFRRQQDAGEMRICRSYDLEEGKAIEVGEVRSNNYCVDGVVICQQVFGAGGIFDDVNVPIRSEGRKSIQHTVELRVVRTDDDNIGWKRDFTHRSLFPGRVALIGTMEVCL